MTTVLMEQGSHIDSGENYEDRDAYFLALERATKKARLAGAMALAKLPMDENYPFYADWLEQVESMPHQGC